MFLIVAYFLLAPADHCLFKRCENEVAENTFSYSDTRHFCSRYTELGYFRTAVRAWL